MKNNSDSAWKEVLDDYFKECIEYCLPEISNLINWEKPYTALDKEFQAIARGTKTGKQLLDKLFKVYLKNGQEQWILIHVEIQAKKEMDFAKRMFIYAYRIYDKFQENILSCAILTDQNKSWRPNCFKIGFGGSFLGLEFLVIKIIDYRKRRKELEESNNIFACVIYNQLCALDLVKNPDQERKQIKFALTKRLYDKGFNKTQIFNLFNFIDWLIGLPVDLEIKYTNEVNLLERTNNMAYVSSMERYGKIIFKEEGREEGREEGLIEGRLEATTTIAKRMLEEGDSPTKIQKITGLSLEEIKALKEKNLTVID